MADTIVFSFNSGQCLTLVRKCTDIKYALLLYGTFQ